MLNSAGRRAAAASIVALAVGFSGTLGMGQARAEAGDWQPLTSTAARTDNPLKGFLPFGAELDHDAVTFPYSMEWFYLPLDAVVKGERVYDWTLVEDQLDAIADRGHQAVFRFYVDYPGKDSGIPDYLLGPDGIDQSRRYDFFDNNGMSFSPDYNDPRVQALLNDFVAALGAKYDGDPRIGFITTGLIGFWGEQHTWPMNGYADAAVGNPDGEQWMPTREVELDHYRAWDAAFDTTHVLNRYPYDGLEGIDVGFHDDSFAVSTLPGPGWHFMDHMIHNNQTERWRVAPIGGEIQPPIQLCVFAPEGCTDVVAEDFDEAVRQTHVSWLMNHQAYATGYEGETLDAALEAHASLGYDYVINEARIASTAAGTEVGIRVTNRGVAPFYYDWPLEFALLNTEGDVLHSVHVDGDLPSILSGTDAEFTTTLPAGEGIVAVRIPNAMAGGAPLKFANVEQDADREGWLTLGTVVVDEQTPGPGPTDEATAHLTAGPSTAPSAEPTVQPATAASSGSSSARPRPGLPSTGVSWTSQAIGCGP